MEERLTNCEHGDEWTLAWLCMSSMVIEFFFFLHGLSLWVCLACLVTYVLLSVLASLYMSLHHELIMGVP